MCRDGSPGYVAPRLRCECVRGDDHTAVPGGLAYTVGVAFLNARRVRYSHFAWHLFVLAGSACHFIAVPRFGA